MRADQYYGLNSWAKNLVLATQVKYVQAQPWHSGPCYYIALKDGSGNPVRESLWTNKEMQ